MVAACAAICHVFTPIVGFVFKFVLLPLTAASRITSLAAWYSPIPFHSSRSRACTQVGGVYLRLFIAQPGWVLRNPREFTVAIMDKFTRLISNASPDVRRVLCASPQLEIMSSLPPNGDLCSLYFSLFYFSKKNQIMLSDRGSVGSVWVLLTR